MYKKTIFQVMALFALTLSLFACAVAKGQYDITSPTTQIIGTFQGITEDGRWILSKENNTLKLWDTDTGREIRTINSGAVTYTQISPDGKRLVTHYSHSNPNNHVLKLWDLESGRALITLNGFFIYISPMYNLSYDYYLFFSPDGKRLVTYRDKIYRLWDTQDGREITTFPSKPTFSHDSKRLFTADGIVWDVENSREMYRLPQNTTAIFTRDVKYMIGYSFQQVEPLPFSLYDAETGEELKTITTPFVVGENAFNKESAAYNLIEWYGLSSDEKALVLVVEIRNRETRFFGDISFIASRYQQLKLLDIESGREIVSTDMGENTSQLSSKSLYYNHDERYVAKFDKEHIMLFDLDSGEKLLNAPHSNSLDPMYYTLCFSPDSQQFIAIIPTKISNYAITDFTVRAWDIASKTESSSFNASGNPSISYDRKKIVTSNRDNSLSLWDVESGTTIKTFWGHEKAINGAFFTREGDKIISYTNNEIRVWNL